jgi:hypothetical protein
MFKRSNASWPVVTFQPRFVMMHDAKTENVFTANQNDMCSRTECCKILSCTALWYWVYFNSPRVAREPKIRNVVPLHSWFMCVFVITNTQQRVDINKYIIYIYINIHHGAYMQQSS